MALYTFLCERGGGTYISQFDSMTLIDAWHAFVKYEDTRSGAPLDLRYFDPEDITVVDTVQSVWCTCKHDENEEFVLIHIIRTDISKPGEGIKA